MRRLGGVLPCFRSVFNLLRDRIRGLIQECLLMISRANVKWTHVSFSMKCAAFPVFRVEIASVGK